MPFKSEAQRRYLFANHPDVAREFADATPKGTKLPEHVKKAHIAGVADALATFGFKQAAEELRLKIPSRTFHGFQAGHQAEAARNAKRANALSADSLAQILDATPVPPTPNDQISSKSHLDRSTAWSTPSNLAGGNNGASGNDMGQTTGFGGI